MVRFLVILFSVLALAGGPAGVALAQEIPVRVDGLPVDFDVPPAMEGGRVLVPFRTIAEALNVQVSWDGATRTVTAVAGENTVQLQIDNPMAYLNGRSIYLDTPPRLLNGRTLIPLRFFGEAFGCRVTWINATKGVRIASPPREMAVIGFYALGSSQASSWTDLFGVPYPATGAGHTDLVGELALGWYSLDGEGNLLTASRTNWQRPEGWEDVLEAAAKYSLRTEMVLHATDQDGAISALLANEAAMDRLVEAIVQESQMYGGVNLDLEGLGRSSAGAELTLVQQHFTAFAGRLAEKLHAAGKTLTLTLHAPNSAYQGYDYAGLGQSADRIIVMAYDYGPRPEPVNLVVQAVEMARAAVPPEKLVLGISVPSETAESILIKVGIAKRYDLNGIALWRLGVLSDEMWEALRSTLMARKGA